MRLSTIFVSSTFLLGGMSTALPVEREGMLLARFADSDFLAEVKARAYDKEPVLYTRGGALSTKENNRLSFRHPPSLPDYSNNNKSPSRTSATYGTYDNQLVARGSLVSKPQHGLVGDLDRNDGRPPGYIVAKQDPPPSYHSSDLLPGHRVGMRDPPPSYPSGSQLPPLPQLPTLQQGLLGVAHFKSLELPLIL